MEKNIESYVINFKNFLGLEICQQTVKELNDAYYHTHTYGDSITHESFSYENDLSVSYDKISTHSTLMSLCWKGTYEYIQSVHLPWFTSWNGYSGIRFNKYDVGTEMRIHCDHIDSMFDGKRKGIPVLTILGCLNDDYKGGDLIMFQDTKIDFKTGDLLIFPSIFLYPHEVTKVTEGTRYSFVSWVY